MNFVVYYLLQSLKNILYQIGADAFFAHKIYSTLYFAIIIQFDEIKTASKTGIILLTFKC